MSTEAELQACRELSAAGSSLSRRGDERSDSGARQQQTQELEATRPAVPPPEWESGEVPHDKLILPSPPRASPAPHNSDKVIMRQDVSTACPGTQGSATRATRSVYMDYSHSHWHRKSAASPLRKVKKQWTKEV